MATSRALATVLGAGLLALLAGAAAAQSFSTVDECAAYYMKTYNLTDSDAKAKCAPLFSPPPSSPTPPPSPLSSPVYSISPAEACIQAAMKEKGLGYDEAKRACLSLPPEASPSADPLLVCIERTQLAKGVSYDEAKRLCAGGFSTPPPDPAMECIARLQKEKGLSYDEAKRACVFGSATSAPVVSEFEKCVALAMEMKRLSKDEAAKACSVSTGPATLAAAASGFNLAGCIEKHVLGGLSKEEATKTCASMATSEARVARAEPPKSVRAEVAEMLKERVAAAKSALGACIEEVKSAVEQCVKAGRGASQCRGEATARVQEACKRPDLATAPAGACTSKCQTVAKECSVTRGEEACRKEALSCLAECPGVGGKFAEMAMKMQKLQEIRMAAKEVRATDEGGNAVEATGETVTMKKGPLAPSAAAPGVAAAAQRPAMVLSLPLKLAQGKRLASFQHEASGIALEKNELSIPMKSGAEIAANIRAKVREVVGRGNVAEAVVERLQMETKAMEADLSSEKPSVGKVLSKIVADLRDMPEEAEVKMKLLSELKEAQETRKKALGEAARGRDLRVKDVAYAVEVEHQNLASTVDGANVTLTVSRAWVDSQGGPELVRIFREGDDGTKQVLETAFLGYDGDNAIFEGRSPGLSVFSLVAVEEGAASPTPTPQPTATPRQPGFEVVVAVVALVAVAAALKGGADKLKVKPRHRVRR